MMMPYPHPGFAQPSFSTPMQPGGSAPVQDWTAQHEMYQNQLAMAMRDNQETHQQIADRFTSQINQLRDEQAELRGRVNAAHDFFHVDAGAKMEDAIAATTLHYLEQEMAANDQGTADSKPPVVNQEAALMTGHGNNIAKDPVAPHPTLATVEAGPNETVKVRAKKAPRVKPPKPQDEAPTEVMMNEPTKKVSQVVALFEQNQKVATERAMVKHHAKQTRPPLEDIVEPPPVDLSNTMMIPFPAIEERPIARLVDAEHRKKAAIVADDETVSLPDNELDPRWREAPTPLLTLSGEERSLPEKEHRVVKSKAVRSGRPTLVKATKS